MGIEGDVIEKASPQEIMGNNVFCLSLAGEEFGRLRTWGTSPSRIADYALASPSHICDCPQDLLEPILLSQAAAHGSLARFNTEYLSLEQDSHGVTATVRDRVGDKTYQVRAKYLLGCDGANSLVAKDIDLPTHGKMDVAGSMNIVFSADLSKYVSHRPGVLYWVLQPGSNIGGIGMGTIRMVRPWHKWLVIWGYDINNPPELNDDTATQIVHNLIGDDSIPIKIHSKSLWGINNMYATRYSKGHVFCLGDAVHRHPPSNGLGSNTSIQDSYNLAWKLALVLKGLANDSLLETYNEERPPVGRQIVERANKSIEEFNPIYEALGFNEAQNVTQMYEGIEMRKKDTPRGAEQREQLRKAIELKNYEFNSHGVEFNQRYHSAAVVADGVPEPTYIRDPELYYQSTTWPGARLPHCWLEHDGQTVSTLDLVGKGRFTLLTGIEGGAAWKKAAEDVSARTGVDIVCLVIGPGCEVLDTYDDWARLREVTESGCILVRPDAHVGWRQAVVSADCTAELTQAMTQMLGLA
ncbi:2,4-dichlorophenol 6-monooxygenase [Ktedonobacter sp. SOSP1-85]|nr:2,4-dichlorophenol 6-monooxygenase [Ktedonobacter sp. SOSP1-85]